MTATPVTSFGADASICTLTYAAIVNNGEVIRQLLETGAEDKDHTAALMALNANNISAFNVLIENIKDHKTIKRLLVLALHSGKDEILDKLLTREAYNDVFNREILPTHAISMAASSGNPQFIEKIINKYKESLGETSDIDAKISAKIVQEHAISIAIQSNSAQCVELLARKLRGDDKLTDQQKLLYLEAAIHMNNPHVVSYFIESLSPEDPLRNFDTKHFTLKTIEKTDLSILRQLKAGGIRFSEEINGIIAKKEHQSIGILLSIGIELRKFTEFWKEKIFKPEVKNTVIIQGKEFAKKLRETLLDSRKDEQSTEQLNDSVTLKGPFQ